MSDQQCRKPKKLGPSPFLPVRRGPGRSWSTRLLTRGSPTAETKTSSLSSMPHGMVTARSRSPSTSSWQSSSLQASPQWWLPSFTPRPRPAGAVGCAGLPHHLLRQGGWQVHPIKFENAGSLDKLKEFVNEQWTPAAAKDDLWGIAKNHLWGTIKNGLWRTIKYALWETFKYQLWETAAIRATGPVGHPLISSWLRMETKYSKTVKVPITWLTALEGSWWIILGLNQSD